MTKPWPDINKRNYFVWDKCSETIVSRRKKKMLSDKLLQRKS